MDPDAKPSGSKIHRTKEVIPPERLGPITFPLAEYRAKQTREIDDTPLTNAFDPDGSLHAVLPEPTRGKPDGPEEVEQENKHCEVPSADLRGQGGVTEHGRPVRPYTGSTRPPHIDPAVWQGILTAKDKQQAINY